MLRHVIQLSGPALATARIPVSVLHEVLGVFVEGTQRAVRLRFLGRSTAPGHQPGWVKEAARFELEQARMGTTALLHFESAPLAEVLPEQFQATTSSKAKSALDLFEEGLEDALGGQVDSERFDEGLVQTFGKLSAVFEQGVDCLRLLNGRELNVDPEGIQRVRQLERQIPEPRAVRVAGKVDAIRHSDRMFTLVLPSGVALRGLADRIDPGQLASLFGQVAMVSGQAVFRPSGAVLRIDAERIQPASTEDTALWGQVPRPLQGPASLRPLRVHQGPQGGINAIFGQWPGEESEEDVRAALEQRS
jgi:hypothetical protein